MRATTPESSGSRPKRFRPELEGLRTVAFLLVAVFHIWVNRVSGGVDVFFVVAGFLVTATLTRHLDEYGRIRIGEYFGRLARRLLPAALLVLSAVLVLVLLLLPSEAWRDRFLQIFASATYWENWFLAFNAVDYLAIDVSRSPVQHFWAMSIQGQFYLLWAVLFSVVALLMRWLRIGWRRVAIIMISLVIVTSFCYSIYRTSDLQQFAYFSTWTRVWEFGGGALLAMIIDRLRLPRFASAIAGWFALLAIVSIGVALPVATLFPGYVATVPALAACLIIIAGQNDARWGATRVLACKPLVWLGSLGYGIYLWHWPVMIFAIEVQGRQKAGPLTGTVVLICSFVLAYLTSRLLERPATRSAKSSSGLVRRGVLVGSVVSLAIVAGTSVAGVAVVDQRAANEREETIALSAADCFGANSLTDVDACAEQRTETEFYPENPGNDRANVADARRCTTGVLGTALKHCTWGNPDGTRVALIGNSHGAVWFPALLEVAERYDWRLDTYVKVACTFNDVPRNTGTEARQQSCSDWSNSLSEHLASVEEYEYVMTSANGHNANFVNPDTDERDPQIGIDGYVSVWQPLVDRGATILAMRDYPRSASWLVRCAQNKPETGCTRPRAEYQVDPEKEVLVQAALALDGAVVVDMTDWFCIEDTCPGVIGGVRVFNDPGHFTATYGRTLAEPLADELHAQADIAPRS